MVRLPQRIAVSRPNLRGFQTCCHTATATYEIYPTLIIIHSKQKYKCIIVTFPGTYGCLQAWTKGILSNLEKQKTDKPCQRIPEISRQSKSN